MREYGVRDVECTILSNTKRVGIDIRRSGRGRWWNREK